MSGKSLSIVGLKFQQLTVVERVPTNVPNRFTWSCLCDCGATTTAQSGDLKRGRAISCGCHRIADGSKSPIYRRWADMKQRCENPKDTNYSRYGGRGISVCDRWLDFKGFHDDLISSYVEGYQLDRIDNDGNYEPENCRWATPKENSNNKSTNVFFEHNGQSKTIAEWSEELGINYHTIVRRIESNWPSKKVLTPL